MSKTQKPETQKNIFNTNKGKHNEAIGPQLLGELRLPKSDEDVHGEEYQDTDLKVAQYKIQFLASAVEAEHRALDAFITL